jgi:regulator of sigma E protease
VQEVHANSAAAQAGIISGDRFVSIAGKVTPTWSDVGMQLVVLWGKKDIPVTLSRTDGKESTVMLDLSQVHFHGFKASLLGQLGMKPNLSASKGVLQAPSLWAAMQQSNEAIGTMVYFFLMTLKQLFSGVIPFGILLGPLGIFSVSVASLTQGVVVFMFFIATLSLAVALVNLFPIPGLDGGSIIYAVIEKIRGKPLSVAMEILLHRLIFIIFCMVLAHLLMNDLQRIS